MPDTLYTWRFLFFFCFLFLGFVLLLFLDFGALGFQIRDYGHGPRVLFVVAVPP